MGRNNMRQKMGILITPKSTQNNMIHTFKHNFKNVIVVKNVFSYHGDFHNPHWLLCNLLTHIFSTTRN